MHVGYIVTARRCCEGNPQTPSWLLLGQGLTVSCIQAAILPGTVPIALSTATVAALARVVSCCTWDLLSEAKQRRVPTSPPPAHWYWEVARCWVRLAPAGVPVAAAGHPGITPGHSLCLSVSLIDFRGFQGQDQGGSVPVPSINPDTA